MKSYIASVLPRLRQYSARLDDLALITDQPWVQINNSGDRVVFVFREEGRELLISRDGQVDTCSWEYLDYMNSLLLKVEGGKYLYNKGFLDEYVMILKRDGDNEYMVLANENMMDVEDKSSIVSHINQNYLESSYSVDGGGVKSEQGRNNVQGSRARVQNEYRDGEKSFPGKDVPDTEDTRAEGVAKFFISLFVLLIVFILYYAMF